MTVRILQIIPTLVRGGAEKQLSLLAAHLPRDEFDVHVCVLTHDGPYGDVLRNNGIPVSVIGKRWKLDPAAYWKVKRFIVRLAPDIVHTWIFAANCYGRQAALAARVRHVVAGERCVDRWKVWHELAIDRYLAGRTDRIVTNSSGVRDFYVHHGIPSDKFTIIPNGIDSAAANAVAEQVAANRSGLLRELGLPPDARMIAAIGRLWPQKRYKDLIWSAELLKAARDDVHLLIIGDGPQQQRLLEYRQQLRIEDRVHFLGARSDVPRLLPHFDCFWLGSGYEGQSNALMEAMAAGVPAVVTDIPGNRDLVLPGETGFLVPVGDCAEFARQTNRLLDDSNLAERLGAAAQQRIRNEFTIAKMVERHAAVYREILLR